MAQYVKIPKDLDDIKEKFVFGFTKRQCLCFTPGIILGIIVFFLLKKYGIELAVACMGIAASPFFIIGLFRWNGMTIGKFLKNLILFLKRPQKRRYISENIYTEIERQAEIERLSKILSGGVMITYEEKTAKNRKNNTHKK